MLAPPPCSCLDIASEVGAAPAASESVCFMLTGSLCHPCCAQCLMQAALVAATPPLNAALRQVSRTLGCVRRTSPCACTPPSGPCAAAQHLLLHNMLAAPGCRSTHGSSSALVTMPPPHSAACSPKGLLLPRPATPNHIPRTLLPSWRALPPPCAGPERLALPKARAWSGRHAAAPVQAHPIPCPHRCQRGRAAQQPARHAGHLPPAGERAGTVHTAHTRTHVLAHTCMHVLKYMYTDAHCSLLARHAPDRPQASHVCSPLLQRLRC